MYLPQLGESYPGVLAMPLQPMILAWVEERTGSLAALMAAEEVVDAPAADDSTPLSQLVVPTVVVCCPYSSVRPL